MPIEEDMPAKNGHDERIEQQSPITSYQDSNGYRVYAVPSGDGEMVVFREHQLVALEKYSPDEVFGDGTVIHYETHQLLNLESCVELCNHVNHMKLHNGQGLWFEGDDGLPRLRYSGSLDELLVRVPSESDDDSSGSAPRANGD